jgi:hypothetical protein
MAFNARLLAPWDPAFVDFNTVDEYGEWVNRLSGELLDAKTADWLNEWMKTANQYDVLWLNDESQPCSPEHADFQIMRK